MLRLLRGDSFVNVGGGGGRGEESWRAWEKFDYEGGVHQSRRQARMIHYIKGNGQGYDSDIGRFWRVEQVTYE